MATAPTTIGRYQVIKRLGTGGMGSVFLARDPELDRQVAIKLVKDDLAEDAELRERFLREARSAARLRHQNIITVFDIGDHDGRPFIAMEYIPGESLGDVVRRRTPIDLQRVLCWMESLCSGLSHAHRAGIVHRDIKPANLMVDADGILKIVDFGIARLGDSQLTRDGVLVGTVNYMAPEQLLGSASDYRADIFAVGAVFYELLTFNRAFPGTIADGLFNRICYESPFPLAQACPGLDDEIEVIVRQALEKDTASRYQDLELMAQDLATVRARLAATDQLMTVGTALTQDAVLTTPVPTPRSGSGVSGSAPGRLTPGSIPLPVRSSTGSSSRPRGDESASQRTRRAEMFVDAAEMAFEKRDYAQCLKLLDDAARFDGTLPAAGDLRERAERAQVAEGDARRRQADLDAALADANACLGRRDLAGARAHLRRAQAVAPDHWNVQALASRLERTESASRQEVPGREARIGSSRRSGVPWVWIVLGLGVALVVGFFLLQ